MRKGTLWCCYHTPAIRSLTRCRHGHKGPRSAALIAGLHRVLAAHSSPPWTIITCCPCFLSLPHPEATHFSPEGLSSHWEIPSGAFRKPKPLPSSMPRQLRFPPWHMLLMPGCFQRSCRIGLQGTRIISNLQALGGWECSLRHVSKYLLFHLHAHDSFIFPFFLVLYTATHPAI